MQRPALRAILKRLAFGPAVFMLAAALPAHADNERAASVHRKVAGEETRVAKALSARDGAALQRSVRTLGALIDDALQRREGGQAVNACDMAAHSLAFTAVSTAESLAHGKEERKMLLADARSAAADFRKDMQACEKLIGKSVGAHTSVEKALKAL